MINLFPINVQIDGAKGEQITFGEMARKIVNIASSLTKLGVKVGDVVAICSENRIEYLIATIAVFCCGGVVTFYNPAYTKGKLSLSRIMKYKISAYVNNT